MSVIVFSFVHLIPGDPVVAILGTEVDQATQQALRHAMGLDRPVLEQYVLWVGRALRGNLGESVRTHEAVSAILAQKLPVTLQLGGMAFVVAVLSMAVIGALVNVVIMRSLRRASTLARVAATLGLYILFQGIVALTWDITPRTPTTEATTKKISWRVFEVI